MNRAETLEEYISRWARHRTPEVSSDVLDALLEIANEIFCNSLSGTDSGFREFMPQKLDWDECYRELAALT